jgi:predicted dehydrogenase
MIGWEHAFVHEFHHFFDAIVNNQPVDPYGATFVDGYRNAVICDAIATSSATGQAVDIAY